MKGEKTMDNLARNAMLASQAGLSYGKWKALQPATAPTKEAELAGLKVCLHCEKAFSGRKNQKYCSLECRGKAYNKKRRKTV